MKMKMLAGFALLMGLHLVAGIAGASTIYYELSGNVSGSIGGNTLTNTFFTFDFVGDTTGVSGTAPIFLNPATSTSIFLSGFGNGAFTSAVVVGVNQSALGIVGFTDPGATNGITFQNAGAVGWDLVSAIGPLTASVPFFVTGTLNTDLGVLIFTDASNLSFTASLSPIPEPSTTVLMGVGLAAIGLLRWRKRR